MGAGASIDEEFRKAKELHNVSDHRREISSDDLSGKPLPPIRLIDFDKFTTHGSFPRYPDNKDIVTSLDLIDRDKSLIVFISHCWLRGYPGAEGWDGRPHPDNAEGDKYNLCVKGIKYVLDSAHGMKNCYIWLDFGCIDQDGSPAGELKQLDKIVECSDIIFTPIHDKDTSWSYPRDGWRNYFTEYKAQPWNDGKFAYLNRGWCRVEMFYAANIPILENENPEIKRYTQFDGGLAVLTKKGVRPHMLYGSKELKERQLPWTLPPLQNSYLKELNPMNGSLSKEEDVVHIVRLMEELKPYLSFVESGYKGETNAAGQYHGFGRYTWDTGMVYEGEYENGQFSGQGVLLYASGDRYEGAFANGMFNGHGTLEYSNSGTYSGNWVNNLYHGTGKFSFPSGLYYEGEFANGTKHGKGIENYAADGPLFNVTYEKGAIISSTQI